MSMEFGQDPDLEAACDPSLVIEPLDPAGALPAGDSNQPTVVERLQQLRWIHIPAILVIATFTVLTLPRLPHISGIPEVHLLLYLLSLPYVMLGIWGLLTRTP